MKDNIIDAQCLVFCKYFETQWLKRVSPSIWNHYDSSDHRTNNRSEGFHSKINRLLISKPSLYTLINLLKVIESDTHLCLEQYLNNSQPIRKKKDIEKDIKIESIKRLYSNNLINFDDFFRQLRAQVT